MTIYYSWAKNHRVSACSGFILKTKNAMRFPWLFCSPWRTAGLLHRLQQARWSLAVLLELVFSVPILSKPDNEKTLYICMDLACHLSAKSTAGCLDHICLKIHLSFSIYLVLWNHRVHTGQLWTIKLPHVRNTVSQMSRGNWPYAHSQPSPNGQENWFNLYFVVTHFATCLKGVKEQP